MSEPEKRPLDPAVRAALDATRPEDYDGHTEFERLTPMERLQWMEEAVALIEQVRAARAAQAKER